MPLGNGSDPLQEYQRVVNRDKVRTQNKLVSLVSLNSFVSSAVSLLILLLPFPKKSGPFPPSSHLHIYLLKP